MPNLELTELECKVMWLICDRIDECPAAEATMLDAESVRAVSTLFSKVYRAYRGIPEQAA